MEAKRLEDRVIYDIEMIKELGYCSGIENYSRYFDRRQAGMRPFCLLDYFPKISYLSLTRVMLLFRKSEACMKATVREN